MKLTDEEIIDHGHRCKESGLGQRVYLKEHLQSAISVSQFRSRLYEARRRSRPKKTALKFIPIKLDNPRQGLTCVVRGKNSLSVEWKAESLAELRKFALAVLAG